MRLGVFKGGCSFEGILYLILIIILLISPMLLVVAGEDKEFEAKEFTENLTIPRNELRAIDFEFQDEKKLEIIYLVQVKDDLPIDVWFVNEDNYLLLSGGAQFLYFLDGSDKQVSYAKKVVTLTKHDNYKLVITNYYSNQTVQVDVVGEIRTFEEESEETFWESDIFLYSLIIIIIILLIVIIGLVLKIRNLKQVQPKESDKDSAKKKKDKKAKEAKTETSTKKAKKTKGKASSAEFCGHCGEPADTPFCKKCGREV